MVIDILSERKYTRSLDVGECSIRQQLPLHDEASLLLATMHLMSQGWPIVGGMHSNVMRVVTQMAAVHTFPPPVQDIHGGGYSAVTSLDPFRSVCSAWSNEGANTG